MAKKKTARKSKAGAARPAKRVRLHEAPSRVQKKVFSGINALLKENGIAGRVNALHLEAMGGLPGPDGGCPEGQVRRTVCFRRDDGVLVCEERCTPI